MAEQRRSAQTTALKERLLTWAKNVREQAERLPPGPEREAQLKRAGLADTAAQIDSWANSPSLQPPK